MSWGIIRYLPQSGTFCDDDKSAFDGWYESRSWVTPIAETWKKQYPDWVVAIVTASEDDMRFPNEEQRRKLKSKR